MNWISVNYPSESVQKYHLSDGPSNKVVLKYNIEQQSARISDDNSQRLFFITKVGGLWNNRVTVTNEYGVESGRITFDRNFHAGIIEIEGKKYHYRIEGTSASKIILYEHNMSMPSISCDINTSSFASKDLALEYTCLILGLCWFLSPVPAQVPVELITVAGY
jgi:hypothetical protein